MINSYAAEASIVLLFRPFCCSVDFRGYVAESSANLAIARRVKDSGSLASEIRRVIEKDRVYLEKRLLANLRILIGQAEDKFRQHGNRLHCSCGNASGRCRNTSVCSELQSHWIRC